MSARPLITIYTLPVSGGRFPIQLGLLLAVEAAHDHNAREALRQSTPVAAVTTSDRRPDIVLASSGGNIATYMAIAADFSKERAVTQIRSMRTDNFLSSWAIFVPSWLYFPFERSLFRSGYGISNFVHSWFTEGALAAAPEVWTGICNTKTRQHRVATNKAKGETILVPELFRPGASSTCQSSEWSAHFIGNNTSPIYAASDRDVVAKIAYASAAIPWLLKAVNINGEHYCDGGSLHASPLSVMSEEVAAVSAAAVRLWYFSSTPFVSPVAVAGGGVGAAGGENVAMLLSSIATSDVRAFMSVAARRLSLTAEELKRPEHRAQMNTAALAALLRELILPFPSPSFAILLFPHEQSEGLDLTNLRQDDAIGLVESAMENIDAVIWRRRL